MGPKVCPEISAKNYQYALRNISEERISHPHRDREPEVSHLFAICESYKSCRTPQDITGSLTSLLVSLHFSKCIFSWGNKIEAYEMGGACRMHLREISFYKYSCSNLRNRDRLENVPFDERIILKWIINRQRENEGGS